jgi:sodium/potassium-transporting ATPase subunit alpha
MAKSKVLVKNLATIETLSCVNVIASDKTGTLTQNVMFVGNALSGLEGVSLKTTEENNSNLKASMATKQLVAAASLCNNAHFAEEDTTLPGSVKRRGNKSISSSSSLESSHSYLTRKAIGDATDVALLRFAASHNNGELVKLPDMYDCTREIPFNSRNKWMMKTVRAKDSNVHSVMFGHEASHDSELMFVKGAPGRYFFC